MLAGGVLRQAGGMAVFCGSGETGLSDIVHHRNQKRFRSSVVNLLQCVVSAAFFFSFFSLFLFPVDRISLIKGLFR